MPQSTSERLRSVDVSINAGFLAATLAALGAVYFCALRPLDQAIDGLHSGIADSQALYQRRSVVTKLRQSLLAQKVTAERALADMLQRMPTAPRESDFLAQVCHLAQRTDLEILDYHPGSTDTRPECREMQVRVSARGDYPALSRFLADVHKLPRLSRLTHLDVALIDGKHELAVEMTYGIFFSPGVDAEHTLARNK